MNMVVIISYIMTILAIVNIILIAIYIFSGHFPLWIFIWQGIWGILVAIVLIAVSRRYKDHQERRIASN
jgi:hypothetical protein